MSAVDQCLTDTYLRRMLEPSNNMARRRDHPEMREDEVWFSNIADPEGPNAHHSAWKIEDLPFSYVRLGTMAFSASCASMKGFLPVFLRVSEVELMLLRRRVNALEEAAYGP